MRRNTHFDQLPDRYLFKEVAVHAANYQANHPDCRILRMGVGDVSRPLPSAIIRAMHDAVGELAYSDTFRGYGPEEGYEWLRQAVIDNEYTPRRISLDIDEVFISEGAGSDLGNLSELFDSKNSVAILDPSYPAYMDSSLMAGREIISLPCTISNGFVPELPRQKADIIYLCLPNNPTGTVLHRDELQRWVNYALENHSIVIFDAAYEAYISDNDIPHSIYELDGAKQVAIEVRSFSKSAGFTAVRCGYTVVPKETGLQGMWMRRQCTKYNGTSYVAQRAALATFTPEGKRGIKANLAYYKQTAQIIAGGLTALGYEVYGGENAPYIWCKTPDNMTSWDFFDFLLNECQVLCTPGVGFGPSGEGFVRFSAFSQRENCEEALIRIKNGFREVPCVRSKLSR